MTRQSGLPRMLKVMFDRVAAALLIILLSPLMLVIGGLILVLMGRPVLFRQRRPGHRATLFDLLKFRTMTDARSADGVLLPDQARITRFGRALRTSSLDELPQLINVLRGELSFVGPRPLLLQYLARYTPEQARRHEVIPGITGWAQVNGRNALAWEDKFALDVWYVDHWSLALDFRILAKTILSVIRRQGIAYPGESTMPEFFGAGSPSGSGQEGGRDHRIGTEAG